MPEPQPKSLPDDRVARLLDVPDGCFGYSGDNWEQILVQLCAVMTVEYKLTHQCLSYLAGALSGALDLIVILELLD
jgi:hypothetical protein